MWCSESGSDGLHRHYHDGTPATGVVVEFATQPAILIEIGVGYQVSIIQRELTPIGRQIPFPLASALVRYHGASQAVFVGPQHGQ